MIHVNGNLTLRESKGMAFWYSISNVDIWLNQMLQRNVQTRPDPTNIQWDWQQRCCLCLVLPGSLHPQRSRAACARTIVGSQVGSGQPNGLGSWLDFRPVYTTKSGSNHLNWTRVNSEFDLNQTWIPILTPLPTFLRLK